MENGEQGIIGETTYRRSHMCINITGLLRNYKRKSLAGLIEDDDGKGWSDQKVRIYLTECLNKGWKVIPMGDCDNFDYQTGCKGHPITKEEYEKSNG